jgi:hypothetical protein
MNNPLPRCIDQSFLLRCLPALLVLVLGMWCSSGSLAIYAVTLDGPQVSEHCSYLRNIDHGNFVGTYLLLEGFPRHTWEWSVVLRRMLYPLFAYPFMKMWGFDHGGFAANIVLYCVTLLLFVTHIRRRFGDQASVAAGWLLATYPGISYWAGLPYSYNAIVPMSLLAATCIYEISLTSSLKRILLLSLILGIAFTGYDLLPFFAPAAMLVLLAQRKWIAIPVTAVCMVVPSVLMAAWLSHWHGVNFSNSNTAAYNSIINAYLSPPPFSQWWPVIADVPKIALHNFVFSNFLFLPLLFCVLLAAKISAWRTWPGLSLTEGAILATAVLLFLFNNLAPPYPGWQLRGLWIARIYQPLFVVFLFYIVRLYAGLDDSKRRRFVNIAVISTVVLNATVVFGPITNWRIAAPVYYNFYRHSPPQKMGENIARFGQRPLGICRDVTAQN